MPAPPLHYNQYYLEQHQMPPPQFPQHVPPQQLDPSIHPQLQSPQAQMQMDPALTSYYLYPYSQQQQQAQAPPQQILAAPQPSVHPQLSIGHSPSSSGGSDYIATPPADSGSMSSNGKRDSSSLRESGASGSRKKHKSDDDIDDHMSPSTEHGEVKVKATRGSRACTVCRRLKMKCVGAEQGPPCKRCQSGNHECIFEESNRGKRSSNSNSLRKHEQLTRSLRKMEKTLDTVLRSINNPALTSIASGMASRSPSPSEQTAKTQALIDSPSPPPSTIASLPSGHHGGSPRLHALPDNELNPLGLLAEASLANRRAQTRATQSRGSEPSSSESNTKVGVASDLYFKPGPMTILPLRRLYIERQVQPEMLSFVTTEEVVELFKIFFNHLNMHCSLLDPELHTPSLVCSRSPFLLTTICAIASKFYPARQELHPRLTNLARKLAFSVPERGYKSVEVVQAYLLLALWGCGPVERYEHDKTWLLLGMGIRVATDLNLHRKTASTGFETSEGKARSKEVHNRERTWLLCYILDRSMSAQMGKPHSIKEDYIIQNAIHWWQQPVAISGDMGLVGYVELQRILSRSLDLLYSGTTTASGLQTDCDYYIVIRTIEAQLRAWQEEWFTRLKSIVSDGNPAITYRKVIGEFYFNYAMLVVNSFGLQNALERSPVDIAHFFSRTYTSAVTCATLIRDELGPKGFLRYSPDTHFVQCSYAVLSLLKLTRPVFKPFLVDEQKTFVLVKEVADLLEKIAVGPLHTPALYSTFLRALIVSRARESSGRDSPAPDSVQRPSDGGSSSETGQMEVIQRNGVHDLGPNFGQPFDSMISPDFQFTSEMGPAMDISTFPPTMAPNHPPEDVSGMLSMDILSSGFWDSVLVPGYSNSLEGLSGGFVFGAGGSGLITPHLATPFHSGSNTPIASRSTEPLSEHKIKAALEAGTQEDVKVAS